MFLNLNFFLGGGGGGCLQPLPLECAPVSIGPYRYTEVQNICPLFYVLHNYVKLINLLVGKYINNKSACKTGLYDTELYKYYRCPISMVL
jgi:hypothetical protein